MDKRHVYEWDTKIHLLARGPGILAGSTWSEPATQVDLAPTWLGLAGLPQPAAMDGKSLAPLLVDSTEATKKAMIAKSTRRHLASVAPQGRAAYAATWRTAAFIEYVITRYDPRVGCT